jgi:ParB-like chromosome segregation protein Spo0J
VVTEGHALVAGRHRLEAARLLGWDTVPVVVVSLNELQTELASLDENLVRNDLSRLEQFEHLARRAELVAALGQRRGPGRHANPASVAGLARTTAESGLSGRTLKRAEQVVRSIPQEVRDLIRMTELADNATELLHLARLGPDEQRDVAGLAAAGRTGTVHDLKLIARRERVREEAAWHAAQATVSDDQCVRVGDFRKGDWVADGEAALVLCDPPYADVPLYGDLARFAARTLRPGGFLAVYADVLRLPQVLVLVSNHLDYFWTLAIQFTGVAKQDNTHRVRSAWKPVLLFNKRPRRKNHPTGCMIWSGAGAMPRGTTRGSSRSRRPPIWWSG